MADGKRWWKMHTSLLTDDKILALSPSDRWAWVALAAHTREHGETGRMVIEPRNPFLALIFGCSPDEVLPTLKRLPNVIVEWGGIVGAEERQNCNSKITLQFKNWRKYAEDNSLERVRKHRGAQKRNAPEERRGEETRLEEKQKRSKALGTESLFGKSDPASPQSWNADDLWLKTFLETQRVLEVDLRATKLLDPKWWDATSEACNGLDTETVQREFGKIAAYFQERPKKRPTPNGFRTFLRRWLERSAEWERKNA